MTSATTPEPGSHGTRYGGRFSGRPTRLESLQFAPVATVVLLSVAMMIKATLIAGWFMHLRWERLALVVIVAATILVTAAFMFFLLIPDALAVLKTGPHT